MAHELDTMARAALSVSKVDSDIRDIPAVEASNVDDSDQPNSDLSRPLATPRAFILAGKAIFTLQGKEARYTFKVQRKEASGQYPDTWFVSLLTGPENTSDYTYLGILDSQAGNVRLTRKSTFKDDSAPVVAIRWALRRIWADKPLPAPAAILHAGRCGRCGRLLTVPTSIESGFGPECIGKI